MAIKDISQSVRMASSQFDINESTNEKNSKFDQMISHNAIQKCLESDDLIFMEGIRKQNDFLTESERQEDHLKAIDEECISAGDFQQAFDERFNNLEEIRKPKLSIFENYSYFDRLFPAFKIQKPGVDYYGRTNLILSIAAYFVFMNYGKLSVDSADYLKNQNSSIFKGDMIVCLLTVISIIIIERYCNRSDTKALAMSQRLTNQDKNFFNPDRFFRS